MMGFYQPPQYMSMIPYPFMTDATGYMIPSYQTGYPYYNQNGQFFYNFHNNTNNNINTPNVNSNLQNIFNSNNKENTSNQKEENSTPQKTNQIKTNNNIKDTQKNKP
jgi:hypothetical protein